MAEIGRGLAFLFLCSVIGLLEIAAAKAFARAFREARAGLQAWWERRRDRRALRAYEPEVAGLEKAWEAER